MAIKTTAKPIFLTTVYVLERNMGTRENTIHTVANWQHRV